MQKALLFIPVISLFIFSACSLNDNPAAYIKDVVAYKEGDGVFVYFILADSTGAMTTSAGEATVRIIETRKDYSKFQPTETERELYKKIVNVEKSYFIKTKVGRGAFSRKVILFAVGRIPDSDFKKYALESSGKLVITFKPTADTELTGEDVIFF